MPSFSRNIWNPRFGGAGDLELGVDSAEPFLPWPSARRYSRWRPETIQLDHIPPVIKSGNGNIFWADEQCTRRVGLTSTEARLFLRLLQVDEPEDWNYADYKEMFDNFGKEQLLLEQLMRDLPWWKLGSRKQKKIWEARVEWLARMSEPRPWLLFLMARRKRIIKQATDRVLEGLRKKSEARSLAGFQMQTVGPEQPSPGRPKSSDHTLVVNDTSKSLDPLANYHPRNMSEPYELSLDMSEAGHAADTTPISTASKLKSVASRIQQSLKTGRRGEHIHEEPSSPLPGGTRKPWEATRQDIKYQVEKLMPKPTPYIVIGWFSAVSSNPIEQIIQFDKEEKLFLVLRQGERDVRGWREYFSLKGLQGFGLYKCDTARGAHIPLILTTSQNATLSQFYLAYRASYRHPDDTVAVAWQGWVHKNLNNGKANPLEGELSLRLVYDWSSYRLASIIGIPLLLSLVIGAWYMNGQGDVVTAWSLALYIVTAAAAVIGLLAIIGTLNDI